LDLIRDVLDNQLVDRFQRRMGKVDGIVIEIRDGRPPLLKFVEVGLATKARRLHPKLYQWVRRRSKPYRIPWTKVRDIGVDMEMDVDADETPLLDFEKRIRKFLTRIPGA
jgi:hypothetical protein